MQVCKHLHFRHMIHCFDFKMTVVLMVYLRFILRTSSKIITTKSLLKGHSTSGKMNVYLKWVIYVEEM